MAKRIARRELFTKYSETIFALDSSISYLMYGIEKGEVSETQKEYVNYQMDKLKKEVNELIYLANDMNNKLCKIKKETDRLKTFL